MPKNLWSANHKLIAITIWRYHATEKAPLSGAFTVARQKYGFGIGNIDLVLGAVYSCHAFYYRDGLKTVRWTVFA